MTVHPTEFKKVMHTEVHLGYAKPRQPLFAIQIGNTETTYSVNPQMGILIPTKVTVIHYQ